MSVLTDRQRIELALPACLLFALINLPGAFTPADPTRAERAEADIAELRRNLRTASLEPFEGLIPGKQQALMRRLERTVKGVTAGWQGRSMISVVLTLWYFLKDLTDREVLILWEGSVMERAMRRLLPMFEHGFAEQARDATAQAEAGVLLDRLQADGWYR